MPKAFFLYKLGIKRNMLTCSSYNQVRRHQVTVINDHSDVTIILKIICLLAHESLN